MYVNDYLQVRVHHSDDDTAAKNASASVGSDHVRLFGPGVARVTPILALKKRADWDTTIDALGFTISYHNMRMSVPAENI